jgi:hypothetical protein
VGRKRTWKRQHLYRSVAGLMLFISAACVPCAPCTQPPPVIVEAPPAAPAPQPAVCEERAHLESVSDYLDRGDFDGAMKKYQDLYSRSPKTPPGDAALFNMGLIAAHYANPRRDYKRSLGYFMRVESDFPSSHFAEEAKIWVSVLHAFEKSKQVDLEIEKKKKGLGK